MKWISVKERLPKDSELVVATSGVPKITHVCRRVEYFGSYIWRLNDSGCHFEDEGVAYWCPLPSFYTTED